MIKKLLLTSLIFIASLALVGCVENEPEKVITLTVNNEFGELTEGDTLQLSYGTNDAEGVTLSSSDTSVLTISETGLVEAVSEGTATITLTSKENSKYTYSFNVTVNRLIIISYPSDEVIITEGETTSIVPTSNDDDGVVYDSTNKEIFVVDTLGNITAKKEGSAYLTFTSVTDSTVQESVKITVRKLINLQLDQTNEIFIVGDGKLISYISNDDVEFVSSNTAVVSVTEQGVMVAEGPGEATITVTSTYDDTVSDMISVVVYNYTEAIEISGNSLMNIGMTNELTITVSPDQAFSTVVWESTDEDIAYVDEDGIVTALQKGMVTITATSTLDDSVVDTFNIEILNILVVDATKQSGDTLQYLGVELEFGINLFSTITNALIAAVDDTAIYVLEGTYIEDFMIDNNSISLIGVNAIIEGDVIVSANDILIMDFQFSGDATISNDELVENFTLENNHILNLTSVGDFLDLNTANGITIVNNIFDDVESDFINIEDFRSGQILIQYNNIINANNAITILAENEYDITTSIGIYRNELNNVNEAFNINLLYGSEQKNIEAIVRFNAIDSYSGFAARSNVSNVIDFTLNFWGTEVLDLNDFENIDPFYLRGNYESKLAITAEEDIKKDVPIFIEITSEVTDITIGDEYKITYRLLPMETDPTKIQFITSNADVLRITLDGDLLPLRSGEATITVRSSILYSVNTQVTFNITTYPGIELTPTNIYNNVMVGDSFTLEALPFPYTIGGEAVNFSSSNDLVATISSEGVVNAVGEGLVVFTATLQSDNTVSNTFTINVYDTLDESYLIDLLTMNQVTYSTPHDLVVYGFQYNFSETRYESVSRYYIGDIPINSENFIPESYDYRPGLMNVLPVGYEPFTELTNAWWVIVHDTASTATGAGALAHTNWLNGGSAGVSWHYTIDDTYIYQHLPEYEYGWHAGDGSTVVGGSTTYLGGGNRNGIGIEMAVNDDGDVMRTWQRTAKLVVDILTRNDMPRTQAKYHNDFSGKNCPNTLRTNGLVPLFEEMVDVEFKVANEHPDAVITFVSNNPEYLDNHGRIIAMPDRPMTVSYTITVVENDVTETRTFYTYLPGTVH